MTRDEKIAKIETLRETAYDLEDMVEQAYDLLDEMRHKLNEGAPEFASQGESYWLHHLDGALAARDSQGGSLINAVDTIGEIRTRMNELQEELDAEDE